MRVNLSKLSETEWAPINDLIDDFKDLENDNEEI